MTWDEYFLSIAYAVSAKSKDSTKVGAVIVSPDKGVVSTGFNGPPIGVDDSPERFIRPEKYKWISHGEQNAIAFAARVGIPTKGCTVYVTHHPCSSCARSLIQAGVKRVMYGMGQTSMPPEEFQAARDMFNEAGVQTDVVPMGSSGA